MKTISFSKYVIVPETVMIIPEFDSFGNIYSKVIEGKHTFLVKKKPRDIVTFSLNRYGSDLQGAMKGSKTIIGPCHMPPIRINGTPDMYWIPYISPNHDLCVWLALHHIEDYEEITNNETRVITSHGHSIPLDIGIKKLVDRINKADQLKIKIEKQTNKTWTFFYDPKIGIELIKDERNNYQVKREKKVEEEE
ncbi:competence protein ComK [Bacillus sp. FJAT-29790]|uniref:competence protein ComK n=1 Tax=Bacillus sp. FJAT-29790 TaxID=1895002 RepID=UPI001C2236BC|nr:competence protein ComK [Bacillus sp. FJAT-29790]MBU8878067.1 competence protein ComK [Bacillus sp. FJAT-29790]